MGDIWKKHKNHLEQPLIKLFLSAYNKNTPPPLIQKLLIQTPDTRHDLPIFFPGSNS